MRKRVLYAVALSLVALLLLPLASCQREELGPEDDSALIGRWHLSKVGDPGDPAMDVEFKADDSFVVYHSGSPSAWLTGTFSVSDGTATGTWRHVVTPATVYGSFSSTVSADVLQFTLYEDFYVLQNKPVKVVEYTGVRM